MTDKQASKIVKDEIKTSFYEAVGRRKTASARARLYSSAQMEFGGKMLNKGEIFVNDLPAAEYFNDEISRDSYFEIFRTTNSTNRFITIVKVRGSGMSGQLGAVVLALARAMVKVDPKFKPLLRKKGYLTRDPRSKERKKPGLMGARKEKQSPKR